MKQRMVKENDKCIMTEEKEGHDEFTYKVEHKKNDNLYIYFSYYTYDGYEDNELVPCHYENRKNSELEIVDEGLDCEDIRTIDLLKFFHEVK